tara:strand:+ start:4462 stop:5187 length:726 start_codon:yes stop_codon:yes gene_type:complete
MNPTPKIFLMLLGATLVFHTALKYMIENIEEFESLPLPPKKIIKISTNNPTIQVDAKIKDSWNLVNFSSGKTHTIKDNEAKEKAFQKINWDLGFSRTKIITNGGATNPLGKTGAINLGPVDFDKISKAPQMGYIEDSISFGNLKNKELSDWYNYRTRTHNIESKKNVYIIKLKDKRFMKMRILNYYCGKKDEECRNMMCSRQQAACLTVEYVLANIGTDQFPQNINEAKLVHSFNSPQNLN